MINLRSKKKKKIAHPSVEHEAYIWCRYTCCTGYVNANTRTLSLSKLIAPIAFALRVNVLMKLIIA